MYKPLFAVKPGGKVAHLILPQHQTALCGRYISWPKAWPDVQPMDKRVCHWCQAKFETVKRDSENRDADREDPLKRPCDTDRCPMINHTHCDVRCHLHEAWVKAVIDPEAGMRFLDFMDAHLRTNLLRRFDIKCIEDLAKIAPIDLLKAKGIGRKTLWAARALLSELLPELPAIWDDANWVSPTQTTES